MNKILEAEDILAGARHCVECVFMAAANLSSREETDPLQAVADIASTKITEAIALLSEYRESGEASGRGSAHRRVSRGGPCAARRTTAASWTAHRRRYPQFCAQFGIFGGRILSPSYNRRRTAQRGHHGRRHQRDSCRG